MGGDGLYRFREPQSRACQTNKYTSDEDVNDSCQHPCITHACGGNCIIALITSDFAVYEKMVAELKSRGLHFVTLRVGDAIPDNVDVVITTSDEADSVLLMTGKSSFMTSPPPRPAGP